VVAGVIYAQNLRWLATPSRSGKPHKAWSTRMINRRDVESYREMWEFLDLPTADVPLLVDDDVLAVSKEYGLPGRASRLARSVTRGPGGAPKRLGRFGGTFQSASLIACLALELH
jgi:hypothetical protein